MCAPGVHNAVATVPEKTSDTKKAVGFMHPYKDIARIPLEGVIPGKAYRILARNGALGVAIKENGIIHYKLARHKFGQIFIDTELDYDHGPPHGTATPYIQLDINPPPDDKCLLAWLIANDRPWYEQQPRRLAMSPAEIVDKII